MRETERSASGGKSSGVGWHSNRNRSFARTLFCGDTVFCSDTDDDKDYI